MRTKGDGHVAGTPREVPEMARQVRSEATRLKVINAAVDLFNEMGYPATGMGDIIERARITKGALYYHFDSKESVAAAVIDNGSATLLATLLSVCQTSAPAVENLIHSTFVVADRMVSDKVARAAAQLRQILGHRSEAAVRANRTWLEAMAAQLARIANEGDLRDDIDPGTAAETIVATTTGAMLMSDGTDLPARLLRMWGILLPAIVPEHSLPYFREFLNREPLRRR
jgi:AcrR family transcriptional regulator